MNSDLKVSSEPKNTFQYLAVATGCLNIICSGMHYGWTSVALPNLLSKDSPIPMTKSDGSWIAAIFVLNILVGANLGIFILDRIGRKNVIRLAAIPFFTSWIMVAFAESVPILIAARSLAGIGDGLMISSLPVYIGEISDPRIRGLLGSCITFTMLSGILMMTIIGSCLTIKTTALIASTLPVILLLTFSWMPESPYYLIMKGNHEQARNSLKTFKGTENVNSELKRLTQAVEQQMANSGRYLDLFTVKSNRRAIFIFMGIRGAQQFSGATAIAFYAQTVFKEAGDIVAPNVATAIYFAMQVVFAGVCTVIVDKTGRKPLMMLSITGSGVCLLIEGIFFCLTNRTDLDTSKYSLVSIFVLLIYVIMFSLGMQVLPMVIMGELFPTNVKAFAMSFCNTYFAITSAIAAKFFQITKDEFGLDVPFFVFATCCALGLVFIILFVPETKGKTLEEIQDELKYRKRNDIELPEIQTMLQKS